MKQVYINWENELKKIFPETLKKDLQDNERICTTCNGLGIVAVSYPYGIKGDTSPEAKNKMFPYVHETLTFCNDCYNGVQNLCKYCGKPVRKGRISECDCAEYEMEQTGIKFSEWEKTIQKAQVVKEEDVNTMLYCEENQKFYSSVQEFIEDWESDHEDEEVPERLWVTTVEELTLDAANILEDACCDLHEEASLNCDTEELQKLLDEYAKKQTGATSYFPCYEQYVRVEK